MRNFIVAILAAFAAFHASAAEMVAKNGDDVIRLQDRPCVHAGTLAQIKLEFRERFRMARARVDGRDWFACWAVLSQGTVGLIYEDGDTKEFPIAIFKLDAGL